MIRRKLVTEADVVEEEAKTVFADAGMALYRAQLLEKGRRIRVSREEPGLT